MSAKCEMNLQLLKKKSPFLYFLSSKWEKVADIFDANNNGDNLRFWPFAVFAIRRVHTFTNLTFILCWPPIECYVCDSSSSFFYILFSFFALTLRSYGLEFTYIST